MCQGLQFCFLILVSANLLPVQQRKLVKIQHMLKVYTEINLRLALEKVPLSEEDSLSWMDIHFSYMYADIGRSYGTEKYKCCLKFIRWRNNSVSRGISFWHPANTKTADMRKHYIKYNTLCPLVSFFFISGSTHFLA